MYLSTQVELEAINEILGSIGESPVNSLENLLNIDAINAQVILTAENKRFQSRGWSFNIIKDYTLNPDTNTKKITWLDNIIYIEGDSKYVNRDGYLYDVTNKTNLFDTALTLDEVIVLTPFSEMPIQARAYITAKASFSFQQRYLGDTTLSQALLNEVKEAWANFQEFEMDNNDFNMLDNTYISDLKDRT